MKILFDLQKKLKSSVFLYSVPNTNVIQTIRKNQIEENEKQFNLHQFRMAIFTDFYLLCQFNLAIIGEVSSAQFNLAIIGDFPSA